MLLNSMCIRVTYQLSPRGATRSESAPCFEPDPRNVVCNLVTSGEREWNWRERERERHTHTHTHTHTLTLTPSQSQTRAMPCSIPRLAVVRVFAVLHQLTWGMELTEMESKSGISETRRGTSRNQSEVYLISEGIPNFKRDASWE